MSIFNFKHFSVSQEKSAMKIGTDSLVLGSILHVENHLYALDIGTGTGVLALMLAQRNKQIKIDALEINLSAFEEATENIKNSPFSNRIDILYGDFTSFQLQKKYDLIVSNPPFFENSSKTDNAHRNQARHSDSLPLEVLFSKSKELLTDNGIFYVILPAQTIDNYINFCESIGLFPSEIVHVFGKKDKLTRKIVAFKLFPTQTIQNKLIVRTESGKYTKEYIELTKEFHDRDLN